MLKQKKRFTDYVVMVLSIFVFVCSIWFTMLVLFI